MSNTRRQLFFANLIGGASLGAALFGITGAATGAIIGLLSAYKTPVQ